MKFALVLLMCFFSVAWQQHVQWASPNIRIPFYPYLNQLSMPIYASILGSELRHLRYSDLPAKPLEDRQLERSLVESYHQEGRTKGDQRSFGLGKVNYLASLILYSLSLTVTKTSYTTTTSTITGATVITCFTSTMFSSTIACRRKRDAVSNLFIGDDERQHLSAPIETVADSAFKLPREGRDVNPGDLISSSQIERETDVEFAPKLSESSIQHRYARDVDIDTVTLTSTVTTYSLSMTTSIRTVTNLAATTALSCLPSGFTLC